MLSSVFQVIDEELLVFKRQIKDDAKADIVVVLINLEGNTRTVNLNDYLSGLPEKMKTVVASIHATTPLG